MAKRVFISYAQSPAENKVFVGQVVIALRVSVLTVISDQDVVSPQGPPEGWPIPLRTTLRLLLTTQHPMYIFWGREYRCFYNDAYARSVGPEKHSIMLGAP